VFYLKKIYLIRHCESTGQEPKANLTNEGLKQAQELADFLKSKNIEYIVSSPFERAIKSIEPLADYNNLDINIDDRLIEKKLCNKNLNDWMDKLKISFEDLTICYDGGESSNQAMNRGVQVIHELIKLENNNIAVVTHGALLILILKYFDRNIGFSEWKRLLNPDVYLLEFKEDGNKLILKLFMK
jgi:2,3-bisphosphoglycerate-dependent phosphoglycerate mutase